MINFNLHYRPVVPIAKPSVKARATEQSENEESIKVITERRVRMERRQNRKRHVRFERRLNTDRREAALQLSV